MRRTNFAQAIRRAPIARDEELNAEWLMLDDMFCPCVSVNGELITMFHAVPMSDEDHAELNIAQSEAVIASRRTDSSMRIKSRRSKHDPHMEPNRLR